MGLREQAKLDARAILEDTSGFAWPVTLISPLGVLTSLRGFTTDVGQTIDPETGQAVAGRRASFSVARAALSELPEAVAEANRKPWIAVFTDSQGVFGTWKVIEVLPDLAVGVVVMILEVFQRQIVILASVSLTLPSLELEGELAPAIAHAGALTLPSLQLSGTETPAVSLAGALAMPSLQLSGIETPAVSLAGSLTLPSLQLSGSFSMALAGSLTLPSLQLSGTITVAASKVSGWLRLAASSQSGGEWTPSIVDVLNAGSPMVQPDVDRRAAVGASANGFPTMVFDGTDVHLWPAIPAHASTTKIGFWLWFKPASVTGVQQLYNLQNGVGGAANRRLSIFTNGAKIQFTAFRDNFNGRSGATPNVLTVGVWTAGYFRYDSSLGGDPNIAIWINGVAQTLTYSNDGAGGPVTTLQAASGSAAIGATTDSDTPTNPIQSGGELGPNPFLAFTDNLTVAEIAAFLAFEAPN